MAALKFLRGSVRVRLRCRFPERAVNICASRQVDFWDMEAEEAGAVLTVHIDGYRRLREAARETGAFSVQPIRKSGAPFLLWGVRKRVALLLGLVLCVGMVADSSLFIWQIDVVGNETVSTARILGELRRLGVDLGASVFTVNRQNLQNELLLRIPELCWITLNTHGSRIEVRVREAVPKPELHDPRVPTEVTAGKTGIITGMMVLSGEPAAAPGDAVEAGETLVSAVLPDGSLAHAEAEVWARTRVEMSLRTPLQTLRKRYTGESDRRTAIIFGGKRINFYFTGGNSPALCDRMTSRSTLHIGDAALPLTLVRERREQYELVPAEWDSAEAERLLKAELLRRLEEELGDGYALSTDFVSTEENGVLTVTLTAECVENIAVSRTLSEEPPAVQ